MRLVKSLFKKKRDLWLYAISEIVYNYINKHDNVNVIDNNNVNVSINVSNRINVNVRKEVNNGRNFEKDKMGC